MKNALDWIKSNPISAVSILVSFLGIGVFAYILLIAAPGLRKRVVEENSRQANDLQALTNAKIDLPDPDPNEPPIEIGPLVINEDIITYVEGVYAVVQGQSTQIKGSTETYNAQAHVNATLAGGRLFGSAEPQPSLFVEAKRDYRNSFDAMFSDDYESLRMPRLVVGMPPTSIEVQDAMLLMLETYLDSVGAEGTSALTQAQAEELYQLQQVTVMDLLATRARSITLYADVMPLPVEEATETPGLGALGGAGVDAGMNRYSAAYPYSIADWSFAAEQPSLDQLWEGQVQLWITRDIMQAIANTNSTQQEQPDGSVTNIARPVIDAPVKRLLRLEVVEGYVGLHNGGAVNPVAGSTGGGGGAASPSLGGGFEPGGAIGGGRPGAGRAGAGRAGAGRAGAGRGANPTAGRGPGAGGPTSINQGLGDGSGDGSGTPAPAIDAVQPSEVYGTPSVATLPGPNQPIIDSFFFGPTGRFSNSVFDVRHTRLTLHIEWAQLPAFFEQLRQVNFMTVIDMTIRDIDEYGQDALADGFVYGENDVVEVELVIESLWFRSWTEPIMPQIVKDALAIPRR